jgi:hypothetical protein
VWSSGWALDIGRAGGGEFCGNWALGFIKSHIFGQIDRIC